MKYKKIKLNRVHNNLASVRDYIWLKCIEKNQGIEFECNGAVMRLEPFELLQGQQEKVRYQSKFSPKEYSLVNFAWRSK